MKPNWDNYFMNIARAVALRSEDPKTKVGAVIVDSDNRIISTGYNGAPKGIVLSKDTWNSPEKHNWVLHAECNSVSYSRQNLKECILYCTLEPCLECSKLIAASGIKKIFYGEMRGDLKAMKLLNACNVTSIFLT